LTSRQFEDHNITARTCSVTTYNFTVLLHNMLTTVRTLINVFKLSVKHKKKTSVALVRERTIPTERPPLVGEVSANFCG
jgi:hypothetical protein